MRQNNHKKWFENFSWKVLAIHKLRCNVKSLAEEARIIRKEEARASLLYSGILREHRIGVLRTEARYAQLALAFLRGKPYRSVENKSNQGVSLERLANKICKACPMGGTHNVSTEIVKWLASCGAEVVAVGLR